MPIPNSFTFCCDAINSVSWQIAEGTNQIKDATVVAKLYWGRSRLAPTLVPGVAVSGLDNISFAYDEPSNQYQVDFSFSAATAPPGGDYMFVVDAKGNGGEQIGHWERPAVVVAAGS